MGQFFARLTGVWREAVTLYFRDGGTWRKAKEVYFRDGGTWHLGYKLAVGFSSAFAVADSSANPEDITFTWEVDGNALGCVVELRTAGGSLLTVRAAPAGSLVYNGDPNVQYRLRLYEPDGAQVDEELLTVAI